MLIGSDGTMILQFHDHPDIELDHEKVELFGLSDPTLHTTMRLERALAILGCVPEIRSEWEGE